MTADPAGLESFFESFGEIHTRLVRASSECADPAMSDLFRAIAAQMETTGAELKGVATKSVEESQKLFLQTMQATENALAQGRQKVGQLHSVVEKNREFLKNAPKQTTKDLRLPTLSAPTMIIPEKKTVPLELTPGDLLRKWLMAPPPAAAQKAGFPHTTGNIWEDWGKLETPSQFEEEEEE